MSSITPEQQAKLNQDFGKLNGKDKGDLLLASVIGRQLGGEWLELIKTAVEEYVAWHEKQHSKFKTCEHCEFIKNNIIMYYGLKHWVETFENATTKK